MALSPLAERTKLAPALTDLGGYEVPVSFGDPRVEYEAACASAILIDVSSTGKIEVSGPEAPQYLHNLSTNDIQSMPLGAGCEAFFCNVRARALFHVRIYRLRLGDRDAMWIDVTPGYDAKLMQHLDRHLIAEQVELQNRTRDFAQMHVTGPKAAEVLSRAIGEPLPDLALHQHMERTIAGVVVHVRRYDPLGLPGFDVVCLNTKAVAVWDALVQAGAMPAGTQAAEWLRVEAGTPVYGIDIDENRFVQEVGRTDAVSFTKGCYLGQEPIVMARDRAGFLSRYFRGLKLSALVDAGTKLFADAEAGLITSCVDSPRFGPIALGYVRRGFEQLGSRLHLAEPSGPDATVVAFPFN
ncbi:MAG: hypothetical protein ACJ8C4_16970 [Gemmataceae bacterium]